MNPICKIHPQEANLEHGATSNCDRPQNSTDDCARRLFPGRDSAIHAIALRQDTRKRYKTKQLRAQARYIREWVAEIEEVYGTSLVTARAVLRFLRSIGLGLSLKGVPLRRAAATGDALGKLGLNLPRLKFRDRFVFDLAFASASQDEKAARQRDLNKLTQHQRSALHFA